MLHLFPEALAAEYEIIEMNKNNYMIWNNNSNNSNIQKCLQNNDIFHEKYLVIETLLLKFISVAIYHRLKMYVFSHFSH